MLKKVQIYPNSNAKSRKIATQLKRKFRNNGFEIVKEKGDIVIAIGGDGTFLRTVHANNFRKSLYVGINTGTLGFAQEIEVEEVDNFIKQLKLKKYKIENIKIQETKIYFANGVDTYDSLNEIVIRSDTLETLKADVLIDDILLENFAGDGILIATSFGSTAYNLSYGGSIVDSSFHTLQITPIAPLNNKNYCNLRNSVIVPTHKKITIVPKETGILLSVDGNNYFYKKIQKIETIIEDKEIPCFRKEHYNFTKKINDKFLK